jgi:hypothetical protein
MPSVHSLTEAGVSDVLSYIVTLPILHFTMFFCLFCDCLARYKGTGVESYACHPGLTRTDLFRKGDHDKMTTFITDWAQWVSGQSAESGALSLLYCATAPELQGKEGRGVMLCVTLVLLKLLKPRVGSVFCPFLSLFCSA